MFDGSRGGRQLQEERVKDGTSDEGGSLLARLEAAD